MSSPFAEMLDSIIHGKDAVSRLMISDGNGVVSSSHGSDVHYRGSSRIKHNSHVNETNHGCHSGKNMKSTSFVNIKSTSFVTVDVCKARFKQAMSGSAAPDPILQECFGTKADDSFTKSHDMYNNFKSNNKTDLNLGHKVDRLGDNNIPVEVIIMRPRYGEPSPHIDVRGTADVGDPVTFPPTDKIVKMTEKNRSYATDNFPAADQYFDNLEEPSMLLGMTPVRALLGGYYMGWNEHNYSFDGINSKYQYPTRNDIPAQPGNDKDIRQSLESLSYSNRIAGGEGPIPDERSYMDKVAAKSGIKELGRHGMTFTKSFQEDQFKKSLLRHAMSAAARSKGKDQGWPTMKQKSQPIDWPKRDGGHRYMPSEGVLVDKDYKLTGHSEGEGREWWGSIADRLLQMLDLDYWQPPYIYSGPRYKYNIPPIRVEVAVEGKFASYDDLPSFAIKLLPPPSGKLNAMNVKVQSPDVYTKVVPEGSFL